MHSQRAAAYALPQFIALHAVGVFFFHAADGLLNQKRVIPFTAAVIFQDINVDAKAAHAVLMEQTHVVNRMVAHHLRLQLLAKHQDGFPPIFPLPVCDRPCVL